MSFPDAVPIILDLNSRCPQCDYDIPPDQTVFIENMTLRCPKCGHEWPEKKWGAGAEE